MNGVREGEEKRECVRVFLWLVGWIGANIYFL